MIMEFRLCPDSKAGAAGLVVTQGAAIKSATAVIISIAAIQIIMLARFQNFRFEPTL